MYRILKIRKTLSMKTLKTHRCVYLILVRYTKKCDYSNKRLPRIVAASFIYKYEFDVKIGQVEL